MLVTATPSPLLSLKGASLCEVATRVKDPTAFLQAGQPHEGGGWLATPQFVRHQSPALAASTIPVKIVSRQHRQQRALMWTA